MCNRVPTTLSGPGKIRVCSLLFYDVICLLFDSFVSSSNPDKTKNMPDRRHRPQGLYNKSTTFRKIITFRKKSYHSPKSQKKHRARAFGGHESTERVARATRKNNSTAEWRRRHDELSHLYKRGKVAGPDGRSSARHRFLII